MKVLVAVAHPDDEVLGFGASGWRLGKLGDEVRVCFLSGSVNARRFRPSDEALQNHARIAQEVLGFGDPWFGPFPNIRMNSVPHLELVQYVEAAIVEHGADLIVTHHPHDVNDDHRQVAKATLAAARLHQRGHQGAPPVRALLHMEVLSSTDWQYASEGSPFSPDTYFECGSAAIEKKIEALRAYEGVMRPYPHPRSVEAIRALAVVRGAESGQEMSEAFVTGFRQWHRLDDGVVLR